MEYHFMLFGVQYKSNVLNCHSITWFILDMKWILSLLKFHLRIVATFIVRFHIKIVVFVASVKIKSIIYEIIWCGVNSYKVVGFIFTICGTRFCRKEVALFFSSYWWSLVCRYCWKDMVKLDYSFLLVWILDVGW